jgi:hypothetical protein
MLMLTSEMGMSKVAEILSEVAKDPERWLQAARETLSETVLDLYEHWSDRWGALTAYSRLRRLRPTEEAV